MMFRNKFSLVGSTQSVAIFAHFMFDFKGIMFAIKVYEESKTKNRLTSIKLRTEFDLRNQNFRSSSSLTQTNKLH